MQITHTNNEKNGAFHAVKDGLEMGEMTYSWVNPTTILIDHTGVEPEFEGQGVGQALFFDACKFARENDVKIIPICPFVIAMFQRMPEYRDVLKDK
jgi:predicted GNAT family acetyltransferase